MIEKKRGENKLLTSILVLWGRFRREILTGIFLTIVLLSVIMVTTYLNFPSIKSVEVVGETTYSDILGVKDVANIDLGNGFFKVNIDSVSSSIKQTSPYLKDAIVKKIFPSKLVIEIKEYTPKFVIDNRNQCVVIDGNNYVIETVERVDNCEKVAKAHKSLLVIVDTVIYQFGKGKTTNLFMLRDIEEISKVLDTYHLEVINCEYKGEVLKCYTKSKKYFVFTSSQSLQDQKVRLISVLEEFTKRSYKFKTLDLRFKRPVIQQ